MSDPQSAPSAPRSDDRVIAAVIYGLYLIGPINGLSALVGIVLAHANVGAAGPKVWSHYVFQIRTFWIAAVWSVIGGAVIVLGGLLMVVLIGFPIFHLGVAILGLATIWFFVRSVVGAIYLAQDRPYPRPRTWLL
ncbi:MAG TPA: hypothetical protein VHY32_06800 [Caulobacteraceae bacterium]|jgi:uncharacterized membrane protein|nr:hypothetical protein [Caulobacteraceae bacterium]